jgi:hypothetical protein
MAKNLFDIDFRILIEWLTPPNKRGATHLAWLRSLVSPLNTKRTSFFDVFLVEQIELVKRNGQKIILEDTLNKVFNPDLFPAIYIDNTGDDVSASVFYNKNEGYPRQLFYNQAEAIPNYIYTEVETFTNKNFIIYVPILVLSSFTSEQIRAEVMKYKPIGPKFTIVTY